MVHLSFASLYTVFVFSCNRIKLTRIFFEKKRSSLSLCQLKNPINVWFNVAYAATVTNDGAIQINSYLVGVGIFHIIKSLRRNVRYIQRKFIFKFQKKMSIRYLPFDSSPISNLTYYIYYSEYKHFKPFM